MSDMEYPGSIGPGQVWGSQGAGPTVEIVRLDFENAKVIYKYVEPLLSS